MQQGNEDVLPARPDLGDRDVASWGEIEREAPELTEVARGYFDAFVHKTLATLRRDGSPRISGIECDFSEGELWLGMMWRSVKALDLQRDPRFALHSGSQDPDKGWSGDAKVAGRAVEANPDPQEGRPSHRFRCDITELIVIHLNEARDRLVIESWHPQRGVERHERD
jgi:hypothetical protein